MTYPTTASQDDRALGVPDTAAQPQRTVRQVELLLNLGHAIDHMFLLIFATAVGTIAAEFGFTRWEDLMPYGVGAFVLFGLGSLCISHGWTRRGVTFIQAIANALRHGPFHWPSVYPR